jgi:RNA recognition motif-containing protein
MWLRYPGFSRVDMKVGYAFAYYNDPDSANAAIAGLHGIVLGGSDIVVEMGKHKEGFSNERGAGGGGDRPSRPFHEHNPKPRSEHRLIATQLDQRTSWQNLKDWARPAGEVDFVDVMYKNGDRVGVVEYSVRT